MLFDLSGIGFILWTGLIATACMAGLFLAQLWEDALSKPKEASVPVPAAILLTVFFIIGIGSLIIVDGPVASYKNTQLNSETDDAKTNFVESFEKEDASVKPMTTDQIEETRKVNKKAEIKTIEREASRREKDGQKSMQDFRNSIINRNK